MLYSPLSNNQWSISAKLQQNSEIAPSRVMKISENTGDLLYGKPLK
jgi:hypothetical protein